MNKGAEKYLEITSLSKIYTNGSKEVVALKSVSFSVFQGDYLAIVGPSGAGKSTLLHILGGLEPPSEGEVIFKGINIYQLNDRDISSWRRKAIGFVFQFYHLLEELSVYENISLACFLKNRNSSLKNTQELLKYLGIEDKRNFFPSQLSGGEKQRVAIARALVNDPEILLCDEPTGNLDIESQSKVMQLLERLNKERKKTLILVTHNLELAKRAERLLYIEGGRIKQ